jgi:hypothetical protein
MLTPILAALFKKCDPAPAVAVRVSAVKAPLGAAVVLAVTAVVPPVDQTVLLLNSSDRNSKFAGAYTIRPVPSTNVALLPRENVTRLSRLPESRFK